jgi:hypothetical protein
VRRFKQLLHYTDQEQQMEHRLQPTGKKSKGLGVSISSHL